MTDDARVEAAAEAIFEQTFRSSSLMPWSGASQKMRAEYNSRARAALAAADRVAGEDIPINVQDPLLLLESLIHFGRSSDGAVERDLRAAIIKLQQKAALALSPGKGSGD